ncbi:Uncharacterised protein [Chlamydia trachomatis]|nr:Uncharacterised protein [Chlamydia trachomatis]
MQKLTVQGKRHKPKISWTESLPLLCHSNVIDGNAKDKNIGI